MEKTATTDPRSLAAWSLLVKHARDNAGLKLRSLLDSAPLRSTEFSLQLEGMVVDFSRSLATGETLELLTRLAEQQHLAANIEALCSGATVNGSERRAALHTALRGTGPAVVDGADVGSKVSQQLDQCLAFADAVRDGSRTGYTGQRFTRVINIGIGGSDLGPRLVADALEDKSNPLTVRFVAGIDGMELQNALQGAEAAATLFIVCSKTFTTLETRLNADAARQWLLAALPQEAVAAHFAAVSVNDAAMDEFGLATDTRFRIWDWVGGRFSLWSAIGLAAAIAIGSDAFRQLLAGAAAMDAHFRSAPLQKNIPVMLGLLAVWQQSFLRVSSHVVLPYDQRLALLPDYLQQLFMESLGKSARVDGGAVSGPTGCAVWGAAGSHSQHSFAQLLHQGTSRIQVDYIGTVNGPEITNGGGHLQGVANLIAQAESLARGQNEAEVRSALLASDCDAAEVARLLPHKLHPGNRPSNIILLRRLDAFSLGRLLALYEHQVFVQSVIWGINPFDQWGVELGKVRAQEFSGFLAKAKADKLPGVAQYIFDWRDPS